MDQDATTPQPAQPAAPDATPPVTDATPEPVLTPGDNDIITPAQAKNWLIATGVIEEVWAKYLEKGLGSAELRSFITIAQGTEAKSLAEVYDAEAARSNTPPADEAMKKRLKLQAAYARNPI